MKAEAVAVGSRSAVDLGADGWVKEARKRRALAAFAEQVEEEVDRLLHRASWLRRKTTRLPLRSNGRAVATAEAVSCEQLAAILPRAQQGQPTPVFRLPAGRHLSRAVRLLHQLQTAE